MYSFTRLLVVVLFFTTSVFAKGKQTMSYKELIGKVEALADEQKNQAALDFLTKESSKITDPVDQAKVLTKKLQLEMSLHGYETSVKKLAEATWPNDVKATALLSLYYAKALQYYHQAYSWEINKREKKISNNTKDLKDLTSNEIFLEANVSLLKSWKLRDQLGKMKKDVLDDFISPNSYPDGVKDTFRDSLSYLFVEMLNNSQGWTHSQTGDLYELNLSKLLGGYTLTDAELNSDSVHPLKKISHVLSDLEKWNLEKKNIQGAMEARLTLYRILHARFTQIEDRSYLRTELTKYFESSISNKWSSMAAADIADFWKATTDADSLITARKFAVRGAAINEKTPGNDRCRDIVADIDEQEFSLQGMKIDGQAKRSLSVNYRNIQKLYLRSYKFDIATFLKKSKDYYQLPQSREIQPLLATKADYEWSVDLEKTIDYKTHTSYITPPNHLDGFYVVIASIKPNFEKNQNILRTVFSSFGPFVLATNNNYEKGTVDFETINGHTGAAYPNVKLSIYRKDWQKGNQFLDSLTTDDKGKAQYSKKDPKNESYGMFVLAESGKALTYADFSMYKNSRGVDSSLKSVIYTDRAIYRPMQKIKFKVLFYHQGSSPGEFKILPNHTTEVVLTDLNGETIKSLSVQSDDFGAAWGEFDIPSGRALGRWSIETDGGYHSVRVEEYKRPTFELSWEEQKTPVRLNQEAVIVGQAKYYFGQALSNGKVKFKISKRSVLPWWCFWGGWDFSFFQKENIVDVGTSTIDEKGDFKIKFTPQADSRASKLVKDIKYYYTVSADVTDEGGETRSSSKTLVIGASSTEALISGPEVFSENSAVELSLSRYLISGGPAAGSGEYRLVSLEEPKQVTMPSEMKAPSFVAKLAALGFKTEGDKSQSRWSPQYNWKFQVRDWAEQSLIKKSHLVTNDRGAAEIKFDKLKAGAYRLIYNSKDERGELFEAQTEFFVFNETYRPKLPLLFFADKQNAKVGETINVWMPSGLKNQDYIFEVHQDGKLLERRNLNTGKDSALIRWPLTENHRGGISFFIRMLNDYQSLKFNESVFVPWDNREIKIETKTFRDRLLPGQKEKWTFVLKGPNDSKLKKGAVQLLAYMYDRSLDQLAMHESTNLMSLYPHRTSHLNSVNYIIGAAPQIGLEYDMYTSRYYSAPGDDEMSFYPSYGIGGPGSREGFGSGGFANAKGGGRYRSKTAVAESMPMAAMADSSEEQMSEAKISKKSDMAKEAPAGKPDQGDNEGNNAPPPEAAQGKDLRTNFSETAFFKPNLTNNEKGEVEVEFEVPDSVTSWSMWMQGFTKDLMAASGQFQTQTVKDLIVRPYLPRFIREGDKVEIRVVVNNTSNDTISGQLNLEMTDSVSAKDISAELGLKSNELSKIGFKVAGGQSYNYTVTIKAPARVGVINFKAVAKADKISDGELRPLPILPGRFHLIQSRFVTLNNKESREMKFDDFGSENDPSRINDKMVVQVDAQLFYGVLSSLPYLVNEPYECTEQTMNRFLSTGIVSSVYKKFPSIQEMAKKMSSRKTRLESFKEEDPNRKMLMEETPWLRESMGGVDEAGQLANILDSRIAESVRKDSLIKLEKAQTSSGGFPWFAGGPPSPYITLYLMYGFSKALEFGVDVPKPMIQKAWGYLHRHYLNEVVNICMRHDSCWETITFLNYVLSNFPDKTWSKEVFSEAERKTMLDFSFKHWKKHSPYLKGYLALTLHRAKRAQDSKLVWDSVMDSAVYKKDEGTFWAREDRSWLWYNDTIETQAFALRTLMELKSDDKKRDGIVEWLFLNKKLNHWKTTRATSEVIYSLVHYLSNTDQLGKKEVIKVKAGSERELTMTFNPDEYTGKKNQMVINGPNLPKSLMPVKVEKDTPGMAFASTTWHYSTEKLPEKAEGDFLSIDRKFFLREAVGKEMQLKPLSEGAQIKVGDEVEVQISIRSKHQVGYVHLRDPRGAGFEPVSVNSTHKWEFGIYWYEEIRDNGTNFFFEQLPKGEYNFRYRLRAANAGEFKVSPATIQPMYAPDFAAFSSGSRVIINQQK